MNKIKFAIVGCGHIGKRHAEMVIRNPQSELVAMADILPKEELFIEDYNVPFFNDLDLMLNSGIEIDVVNVCTPNGYHADQTIKSLSKGCHVVCEKPLGLSKEECENVIFKSLHESKHVFCVMQNRYSPPSIWIKSLITQKILGEIYIVQLNCYWNRDESYYKENSWKGTQNLDGGTLFTQFSHFIDLMYWLFGDIKNIQGNFKDFNHKDLTQFEDSGLVNFDFVRGGIGCLNYSTSVPERNLESSITVIGSNGCIKIGGQYMNKVEYCDIKNYVLPKLDESNPPNDYGSYKGSAANHHYVIENVVNTILGNTYSTTNALEGLKVVDIIERIYKVRDKML